MGGYGSGRPAYKRKAEHCRSLDVNRFHREGCLKPGRQGDWVWSTDGEEVARIGYKTEAGQLVLNYRYRLYDGEWEPITETVGITQVACNYGKSRPYFICPGVVNNRPCMRRVGKLFSGGRYFLCRHCYRVAYSSQSEPRYDRLLRRANKLRMELGGEPGTAYLIASRPKGMWQRTYERKRLEIEWCEGHASQMFVDRFAHLFTFEEQKVFFQP